MTTTRHTFALIGRTFPSESFERLTEAAKASKKARRAGAWDAAVRARPVWRGSGEAIAVAALGR